MDPDVVVQNVERRVRIGYLQFKRLMWFAEAVLLFLVIVLIAAGRPDFTLSAFVFVLQFCRVVGEAINHFQLAHDFNLRDRWHLFPLF